MSLIYNATFDKNTRKLSFEDRAGNEIYSFTVPERAPAVDDITKPLTFKATQDGSTVKLTKYGSPTGSFQTSNDGGNTWVDYTIDTVITLNTGDEVAFRAKSDRTSEQNASNYFYFKMTGKIEAWHNVMSLYRTNDFATYKSVVGYAFSCLFSVCTSLVKAPALPATTLADSCYWDMFSNCNSLTEAPELPATALAVDCYYGMFRSCRSLVKAPELQVTTLANRCFQFMFSGCIKLNEVRCQMPSSYSSSDISSYFTSGWLGGVSSTGTFYTNADANWPSGESGIPEGWNRIPKPAPTVDDINKPLTFKATQDGSTVKLTKYGSPSGNFQTSRDGGNTWTDYTIDTAITLNTGDEVSFRAKADRSAQNTSNYFQFMMEGKIEAWHNVMSMIRTNDFATYNTATTSAFICLFKGCQSLTKAPALPATTLAQSCYYQMFDGCRSLVKAPELPATTLADYCYSNMFVGCSSLNEVHCQIPSSYSSSQISTYTYYWLSNVSPTGTFYTNSDANWPSGASGIPTSWTRINEEAPAVDDITKPLTFKATQDNSSVTLTKNGSPTGDFQTSRDGGNTWTDYTLDSAIALNTGDKVSFRAKADRTSAQDFSDYFRFQMTGKIEAWHNVMSLYRTNDFATYNTMVNYAFTQLFKDCTSLTKAPALPATTLVGDCYMYMFIGCRSLVKAPELPATTLAGDCYQGMFSGCQSLVKAPVLPATTLIGACYRYMFYECQSLKEVRIAATKTASDAMKEWLYGVSATGDFYCDPNATIFPSGKSGIPQNWTRHNIADYPTT